MSVRGSTLLETDIMQAITRPLSLFESLLDANPRTRRSSTLIVGYFISTGVLRGAITGPHQRDALLYGSLYLPTQLTLLQLEECAYAVKLLLKGSQPLGFNLDSASQEELKKI